MTLFPFFKLPPELQLSILYTLPASTFYNALHASPQLKRIALQNRSLLLHQLNSVPSYPAWDDLDNSELLIRFHRVCHRGLHGLEPSVRASKLEIGGEGIDGKCSAVVRIGEEVWVAFLQSGSEVLVLAVMRKGRMEVVDTLLVQSADGERVRILGIGINETILAEIVLYRETETVKPVVQVFLKNEVLGAMKDEEYLVWSAILTGDMRLSWWRDRMTIEPPHHRVVDPEPLSFASSGPMNAAVLWRSGVLDDTDLKVVTTHRMTLSDSVTISGCHSDSPAALMFNGEPERDYFAKRYSLAFNQSPEGHQVVLFKDTSPVFSFEIGGQYTCSFGPARIGELGICATRPLHLHLLLEEMEEGSSFEGPFSSVSYSRQIWHRHMSCTTKISSSNGTTVSAEQSCSDRRLAVATIIPRGESESFFNPPRAYIAKMHHEDPEICTHSRSAEGSYVVHNQEQDDILRTVDVVAELCDLPFDQILRPSHDTLVSSETGYRLAIASKNEIYLYAPDPWLLSECGGTCAVTPDGSPVTRSPSCWEFREYSYTNRDHYYGHSIPPYSEFESESESQSQSQSACLIALTPLVLRPPDPKSTIWHLSFGSPGRSGVEETIVAVTDRGIWAFDFGSESVVDGCDWGGEAGKEGYQRRVQVGVSAPRLV